MEPTLFNLIEIKCNKFYKSVETQVSKTIKESDVVTRPSKSNGLWCCILLPLILNIYSLQYTVSPLYKFVAVISVGLFFYSTLFITFLCLSSTVLQQPVYSGCLASGLISVLLMYTVLDYELPFCLFYSISSTLLFNWLLIVTLRNFQKTFTIGEVMILHQTAVLFIVMSVAKTVSNLEKIDEELDFIYTIINTVLFTVGLITIALSLMTNDQRNLVTLASILGSCGAFGLMILHGLLGLNCISRIIKYVFRQGNRGSLILFWAVLVCIAALLLTVRTRLCVKANTVARKTFHLLASVVFMSGILVDLNLITLASGIGFAALLLTEAIRKSNIEPISPVLQSAFLVYCDEKDSGCFAVTPLYLFVGLACGVVLVPNGAGGEGGATLERLSGVLAIGVGDAAASWYGSNYGFKKWPGGDRTFEGTAFNILSQIATVYTLQLFDLLDAKYALVRTVVAATVNGLVEAKTNQVDNLVLPLVTILAFQATWFLS